MVAESLELMVELRKSTGKGAMRRMRKFDDKVPGIVYGAGKTPQSISLLQKDILKALQNEAVFSSILTISIDDKKQKVVIKDLQRHHTKPKILHIDFQRIKATERLTMNIPLHFIGEDECPGIEQGGVISHLQTEVEVRCLPAALPEYIEVDLSRLELDKSFHLSDLKLPAGVELTIIPDEQHDLPIVSVHIPRVSQADVEAQQAGIVEKSAESRDTKTEIDTDERE